MALSLPEVLESRRRFRAFLQESSTPFDVPPVVTAAQTLPLDQLTWRVFQQLCCRLVEREPDVIPGATHLYGVSVITRRE